MFQSRETFHGSCHWFITAANVFFLTFKTVLRLKSEAIYTQTSGTLLPPTGWRVYINDTGAPEMRGTEKDGIKRSCSENRPDQRVWVRGSIPSGVRHMERGERCNPCCSLGRITQQLCAV